MDDKTLKKNIAGDPFHKGLDKFGKFTGFDERAERKLPGVLPSLTKGEVAESQLKIDRYRESSILQKRLLSLLARYGVPTQVIMGDIYAQKELFSTQEGKSRLVWEKVGFTYPQVVEWLGLDGRRK